VSGVPRVPGVLGELGTAPNDFLSEVVAMIGVVCASRSCLADVRRVGLGMQLRLDGRLVDESLLRLAIARKNWI